jgi:hypothetical protein
VQSVAVAAGIFFALQQYKINSQDTFDKESARRSNAATETINATNNARAAMKKVFDFKTTLTPKDSDAAKEKEFKRFLAETKDFRLAADKINSELLIGAMLGETIPPWFCDAQNKVDEDSNNLDTIIGPLDTYGWYPSDYGTFQFILDACKKSGHKMT